MRLFIALNLPEAVRDAAHAAAEPLRAAAPRLSWTAADKLHVTVKFLGERPESDVAPLAAALGGVARLHAPVALDLRGVGAFPTMRRPRVLWLGVEPDPKLELLHHDVEIACAGLGFEVEGRAFRPHVTLGRVPPRAQPVDAAALARAARHVHFRSAVAVDTIELMLSEAAAGGARYTPLASHSLAAATPAP